MNIYLLPFYLILTLFLVPTISTSISRSGIKNPVAIPRPKDLSAVTSAQSRPASGLISAISTIKDVKTSSWVLAKCRPGQYDPPPPKMRSTDVPLSPPQPGCRKRRWSKRSPSAPRTPVAPKCCTLLGANIRPPFLSRYPLPSRWSSSTRRTMPVPIPRKRKTSCTVDFRTGQAEHTLSTWRVWWLLSSSARTAAWASSSRRTSRSTAGSAYMWYRTQKAPGTVLFRKAMQAPTSPRAVSASGMPVASLWRSRACTAPDPPST